MAKVKRTGAGQSNPTVKELHETRMANEAKEAPKIIEPTEMPKPEIVEEGFAPLTDTGAHAQPWKKNPTECHACGKDLRQLSMTFNIKDKTGMAFCSRECRATVTGEEIRVSTAKPAPEPATLSPKAAATTAKAAQNAPKGKAAKPKEQAPKAAKEKGTRAGAPWSNLTGKMHLTGKQPPKFQGNRKQVWDMIKEGMTVGALYQKCNAAQLDGKSNLAKIIGVYGCVEVR